MRFTRENQWFVCEVCSNRGLTDSFSGFCGINQACKGEKIAHLGFKNMEFFIG